MKGEIIKPKIEIEYELIDWIVESIGVIAIVILVILPIYHYGSLPDIIPSDYGSNGEPDGYSGKGVIWLFPVFGFVMYFGVTVLNRFPHIYNYPKEITQENAHRQYKLATRLLRILNTIIACGFCYLIYSTIQIAHGNQNGLGNYFISVFMVSIFGTIGTYLYKSITEK